jgi:trehalose utilization protein
MPHAPRVTVWNEYRHERSDEEVAKVYPDGIHGTLAVALSHGGLEVRTATLDEPEHGLTEEVLHATDVLLWWGHMAHNEVADEVVERVHERVLAGMGLVVLHSGHFSKIFRRLVGTSCDLKWRHDDRERLWVVAPGHQIAEGLGEYIELEEEMYGEPFDVPPPEELVFVSWFGGGGFPERLLLQEGTRQALLLPSRPRDQPLISQSGRAAHNKECRPLGRSDARQSPRLWPHGAAGVERRKTAKESYLRRKDHL